MVISIHVNSISFTRSPVMSKMQLTIVTKEYKFTWFGEVITHRLESRQLELF